MSSPMLPIYYNKCFFLRGLIDVMVEWEYFESQEVDLFEVAEHGQCGFATRECLGQGGWFIFCRAQVAGFPENDGYLGQDR